MLWSKEDINFDNDDLAELNQWAQLHAKHCKIMELALNDELPLFYTVKVECSLIISHGISCQCGETYNVGDLEPYDLWPEKEGII